ncbi:MAG: lipopolysaccharide transport periplasmic protein LptA, partial [Ottowia sp.]|nr:lipopolysaccharide transport periplasmic protein LptA [Ottowia sp.]
MSRPMFPFSRMLPPAIALAAALCAVFPAAAERADRDQPMRIDADALRYENTERISTFTGNVVVTKGTILMRGAELRVRQDEAGNQFAVMTGGAGKRAFFRQKREGVNEFIEGEGEVIEYDSITDTAHLHRRAEMRRLVGDALQDEVHGALIVYNNRTEVYTVDGAPRQAAPGSSTGRSRVSATLA